MICSVCNKQLPANVALLPTINGEPVHHNCWYDTAAPKENRYRWT